jgi:hypothetical protein
VTPAAHRGSWSPEVLVALDLEREVDIETRGEDGGVHRTTIWVVVDGTDVFIRSYRGAGARWYRELAAGGEAALYVGPARVPVRPVPATDAESVERCSAGLRAKYEGDPSTPAMVRPEVLATTIRLVPA